MPMRDQSIDIETLSIETDAAIVAIGCQEFDIETGKFGRKFFNKIDLQSALKGSRVDGDTLIWWMRQSQAAREETFAIYDNAETHALPVALDALATFIRSSYGNPCRVWARGTHFDIAILEWNYRHGCVGLASPWHHRNVHDLRTLLEAAGSIAGFDETSIEFVGTKHNALSDAQHQARVISAAYKALRDACGTPIKNAGKPKPLPEFQYWSHPESDSMFKLPYGQDPGDPLCVEVDEATFKAWDDDQL